MGLDVEDVAAKDLQPGYVASNSNNDPAMGAADFTSYVIITKDPGMIQTGYTLVLDCHTSHVAVEFSGKEIAKMPGFLMNGVMLLLLR